MREKLRGAIETLFADAPQTQATVELKEEILQNLQERFDDLRAQGKSEEAAYNIALAGVGDVNELLEGVRPARKTPEATAQVQRGQLRRAILTASAVMLYILSVVPVIILSWLGMEDIGVVAMFGMIAVATALLVFNHALRPRPGPPANITAEFQQWRQSNDSRRSLYKAVTSAMWALVVVAYMLISFATGAWHITWVIFLIAGAINSIIKAFFDLWK